MAEVPEKRAAPPPPAVALYNTLWGRMEAQNVILRYVVLTLFLVSFAFCAAIWFYSGRDPVVAYSEWGVMTPAKYDRVSKVSATEVRDFAKYVFEKVYTYDKEQYDLKSIGPLSTPDVKRLFEDSYVQLTQKVVAKALWSGSCFVKDVTITGASGNIIQVSVTLVHTQNRNDPALRREMVILANLIVVPRSQKNVWGLGLMRIVKQTYDGKTITSIRDAGFE